MSRYLDRLPSDAKAHFSYLCHERGVPFGGVEDALIHAARQSLAPHINRAAYLIEAFGEFDAIESGAVLDQIIADLDSEAEVASEPVDEVAATNNTRFVFAQIEGASPEQVETFAKMIGGILAQRG